MGGITGGAQDQRICSMGAIAELLEGPEPASMRGRDQRGSSEGSVAVRNADAPECSACIHHMHAEHFHTLLKITSGRTMAKSSRALFSARTITPKCGWER